MAFRITKVYTKQGDGGDTRLGGGQVVRKDSIRVRAYGAIDELNSTLGLVAAADPVPTVEEILKRIQNELFTVGGQLCVLVPDQQKWQMPALAPENVQQLEEHIDKLNSELAPLEDFILPGGAAAAAFLHQARCVCRRAETLVVELAASEEIGDHLLEYVNRLSDLLFVLARYENFKRGVADVCWTKDKPGFSGTS